MTTHRYCDGLRRRDFVQAGLLGTGLFATGNLGLSNFLRRAAAGEVQSNAKAKQAIFVYLGGGPTHLDTFDLKPDAPEEIRGPFKPIDTNVSGLQISEHLPLLAKCADKYTVVRGVSHTLAAHDLGTRYMNTGNRPLPSLVHPAYGAVVARELGGPADLPPFVAVPNTPQRSGYLGVQYAALETTTQPTLGMPFAVRGIALDEGVTVEQVEDRRKLLKQLDTTFDEVAASSRLVSGLDRFSAQAHDIIRSPKARTAFDTSLEPAPIAERFGASKFGQSCLLATRLIEAGVTFATVSFSGWDTHSGNFKNCQESLLPALDQGLSALFVTLAERGLLDSTLVYVTGEFGRTPKINEKAGRDHWPRAMFTLFAGGGIPGGRVLGASDAKGQEPASVGYSPDQLAATFYRTLGIDHRKEYDTPSGRPVMIVRDGSIIQELLG
jgi:hypothetical protein